MPAKPVGTRTTPTQTGDAMAQLDLPGGETDWLDVECHRLLDFGRRFPHPSGGAAWLDDAGDARPRPAGAHLRHRQDGARLQRGPSSRLCRCRSPGRPRPERPPRTVAGSDPRWLVHPCRRNAPVPDIKSCYDHAFVVLAASSATVAGRPGAAELLAEALTILNDRFWDPDEGMYADHWDLTWTNLSTYRGINPNMHAVEALLAATDATGETRWRQRALGIAERVVEFARERQWRIPEHFDPAWRPLLEHNRDDPMIRSSRTERPSDTAWSGRA